MADFIRGDLPQIREFERQCTRLGPKAPYRIVGLEYPNGISDDAVLQVVAKPETDEADLIEKLSAAGFDFEFS